MQKPSIEADSFKMVDVIFEHEIKRSCVRLITLLFLRRDMDNLYGNVVCGANAVLAIAEMCIQQFSGL